MIKGFLIICFLAFQLQAVAANDFVVIVHPSVPENTISKHDLKQILLTNKTTWRDGRKIVVIALNPEASGADAPLEEFMGMTSLQAKKHWLTKVFNGVIPSQPPLEDTIEDVVEKVANTSGAIAIVPKNIKTGRTKILNLLD